MAGPVHPDRKELTKLRAMADYLFGRGAGRALFPDSVNVVKSSGRIRQVLLGGEPVCAIRASDGHIKLNRRGAELLHSAFPPPRLRVVISEEAVPFAGSGRTVFAPHVKSADPEIRPGEEVLVVDEEDRLIASGTAILSGEEMSAFRHGMAVAVRRGYRSG
ncbi:MAG: PUA domain-containing protein [Candidatus Hadarchaeales archaeon]